MWYGIIHYCLDINIEEMVADLQKRGYDAVAIKKIVAGVQDAQAGRVYSEKEVLA